MKARQKNLTHYKMVNTGITDSYLPQSNQVAMEGETFLHSSDPKKPTICGSYTTSSTNLKHMELHLFMLTLCSDPPTSWSHQSLWLRYHRRLIKEGHILPPTSSKTLVNSATGHTASTQIFQHHDWLQSNWVWNHSPNDNTRQLLTMCAANGLSVYGLLVRCLNNHRWTWI